MGEAEVGAADEFYLDAWAASVVVGVTGIAGHVADADDLHAEEVVQAVAGDNGGGAVAHLTFLTSWPTVVGVVMLAFLVSVPGFFQFIAGGFYIDVIEKRRVFVGKDDSCSVLANVDFP